MWSGSQIEDTSSKLWILHPLSIKSCPDRGSCPGYTCSSVHVFLNDRPAGLFILIRSGSIPASVSTLYKLIESAKEFLPDRECVTMVENVYIRVWLKHLTMVLCKSIQLLARWITPTFRVYHPSWHGHTLNPAATVCCAVAFFLSTPFRLSIACACHRVWCQHCLLSKSGGVTLFTKLSIVVIS